MYTVGFNAFDLGFGITTFVGGVIWGLVWDVLLLVGAMTFRGKLVLKLDPDRTQMMSMAAAHLAYGLVLAAAVPHLR